MPAGVEGTAAEGPGAGGEGPGAISRRGEQPYPAGYRRGVAGSGSALDGVTDAGLSVPAVGAESESRLVGPLQRASFFRACRRGSSRSRLDIHPSSRLHVSGTATERPRGYAPGGKDTGIVRPKGHARIRAPRRFVHDLCP